MKAKTLMVLGARRAQLPAIHAAVRMGLRVVAIDPDPAAPGLALVDRGYSYDLADFDAILGAAVTNRIDGIMTLAADYPMPVLARICAELDLPGPSVQAVSLSTNKRLMREAFRSAGVPCPRFVHATDLDEARRAVGVMQSDTVFKPAMSQGGRGVTMVPLGSPDAQIEKAFARALKETRADGVMVEERVVGPEFSVESLNAGGTRAVIAVTDKLTSGAPHFVELGHSQPSRQPSEDVEKLRAVAVAALDALGVQQAAGHTEVRLSAEGPVVMESAARLGGGFITTDLVPLTTGLDMVAATVRVALGMPGGLAPAGHARAAAVRFLTAEPGCVVAIHGVGDARCMPGVESLDLYVGVRDSAPPLVDSRGRLGHVICAAGTADEAIECAEAALDRIHIETRPTPS